MRKTFFSIIFFAVAFFAGCERYDHAIQDLNDRIEVLEGSSIAPIEEQIRNIKASLADLQDVDKSLSGLIESLNEAASALQTKIDNNAAADAAAKKALEDELASVKELITALQKEDKSLDTKIADLKTYVDQIKASVDKDVADAKAWVSTTFATLEQYEEMQTAIATISALVDTYKTDLEKGYTDAIAAAVADMEDAISDSEDAMEVWVNETLADGYYDIAAIDALLTALETKLAGADSDLAAADAELAKQIEKQIEALEQASKNLTAAYEKAIKDAITENNGKISAEIAAAVKTAQDNLQAQIDDINEEIENIKARLDIIEANINTINQQITAINSSIDDLKDVDDELEGYISTLQTTAADLQSQIDATNTALSALESDLEGQITASEQKVLDELNTVKTALEGELTTINNTIATLQAKDAELGQKIADLQKYVDDEITATEDWARATFSTLEQYEATQTVISKINALIKSTQESITALEEKLGKKIADDIAAAVAGVNADVAAKVQEITDAYNEAIATTKTAIEAAYSKAIEEAIKASEAKMENWVNGVLADGYYKKAEIDGKITALAIQVAEGDEAVQKEIDALETALAKAESDLTAAYEKAIKDAITENNGKITAEITAAVNTAQDNLQAQIDDINEEIDDIKDRLVALEDKVEDLIARIQSIRFLPEYSDGKVELTPTNPTAELTFLISPSNLAAKIATAYTNNTSVVTAYLSRIQPRTRAVDEPTAINVTNVTGADGMLTVKVNAENLPADYWATAENANLFIRISDGNNDVISEMIPTFYTVICELPNGDTFRTAVHNLMTDDTKAIKFIANSKVVTEHQIGTSPAYMQLNGITLEIHTAAKEFIFNANCTYMFSCGETGYDKFAKLTAIDFNDCINTSNVTNMQGMFYKCKALNSLDLSSFNTANVTDMSYMFYYCMVLKSLDLSSFNTANVTNMTYMFSYCNALESLDIRNFDMGKVTNSSKMFSSVGSLYYYNTSNKTSIKVTMALKSVLESMDNVLSAGSSAEYDIVDN